MFGWFKRDKQPATYMDAFIKSMYGRNTKKTANLLEAIALANSELLRGRFDKKEITDLATALYNGPVPYSTHDLAVSVALGLLKKAPKELRRGLFDVQLGARMTVAGWAEEGKVVIPLVEAFEHTLYTEYHPDRLV